MTEGLKVNCDAYDCEKTITIPNSKLNQLEMNHGWYFLAWEEMYYCPTCATKRELITNEQQRPT